MRSLLFLCLALASLGPAQTVADLERGFATPPSDARPMMRWWWFGPAVTKEGVAKELRTMKEGGIGGVEVQPVYPVSLDDPARGLKNLPYLSPEFLDVLKFSAEEAKRLGLRWDVTLGSGWPYGGPSVGVEHASGRLRIERVNARTRRVPLPSIGAGERLLGVYLGREELKPGAGNTVQLGPQVTLPAEVSLVVESLSGMQVKRPGVGGEGFVLNHYDRPALDQYLKSVATPLLAPLGPGAAESLFCDSLEVYGGDWTPQMFSEFSRRRGYDLRAHLPALLTRQPSKEDLEIRHDWALTLTEMLEDNFLKPLHAFAASQKSKLRMQGYGIPPMAMSSNQYVDVPEGEGAQWKVVRAGRWAASAAHLYDRPVSTSETWTWLHSPSFRATPLDMKAEADLHFVQGVTQLIGHGWPYNPPDEAYPGNRFYAAAVFNDRNPWWTVMPDLSRYLSRISWLLRQGTSANDIALYLPNADAYAGMSPGRIHLIEDLRAHVGQVIMPQIIESGYNLDFVDDGAISKLSRYKAVVLPKVERMPLAAAQALVAFAKAGGKVFAVGRSPERIPGWQPKASDRTLAAQVFAELKSLAIEVPTDATLGAALQKAITPQLKADSGQQALGFIARRAKDADIYFLANTSNRPIDFTPQFRDRRPAAERWNAFTGERTRWTPGALHLEPYESTVILFRDASSAPAPIPTGTVAGQFNAPWTLRIGSATPAPTSFTSWTANPATEFFSGAATYSTTLTYSSTRGRAWLDLGSGTALPVQETGKNPGIRAWYDGPVREAAEVLVNGQRLGILLGPPYRLELTPALKEGSNIVEIRVANTAINFLAGTRLPDYRLLNLKYGVRFEPQDMKDLKPLESGLLRAPALLWEK